MLGRLDDGSLDGAQARAVLTAYVDAGGNLVDSSEIYAGGRAEELIGEHLREQRDDLILLTKYSRSTSPDPSHGRFGNHRKAMQQSIEGSLRRLRTDRVDVFMAHLDDGETPMEEIMRGFESLIAAGKVIYAGLSNFPAWRTAQAATLAECREWTRLAAIEVEYSLLQRTVEREILPMASAFNMGVLGYSPLAGGKLRGAGYKSSSAMAKSRPELKTEADTAIVSKAVGQIAAELQCDEGAVALAWVSSKGVVPIIGARTATQLAENLRAGDVQLSPEHLVALDVAAEFSLGYPQQLLAEMRQRRAES